MIIKIKLPDIFVPEEKEFQIYCTLKLFKSKYITEEEAIMMCGYGKEPFNELYNYFEKKYIRMCGYGYSDSDFLDDMKMEDNKATKISV